MQSLNQRVAHIPYEYEDLTSGEYGNLEYGSAEPVFPGMWQNNMYLTHRAQFHARDLIEMWNQHMTRMSVGSYGILTEFANPEYPSNLILNTPPSSILPKNLADTVIVVDVRDVPYDEAKQEIVNYITKLQKEGVSDLSIGEIAMDLELDLDIVIEVFEERGLTC
jgi:hypothetical protein